MSFLNFSIDTSSIQKGLSNFKRRFNQPFYLGLLGRVGTAWIIENFETEGGNTAEGQWTALSPVTVKKRLAAGRSSSPILRDTWAMFNSLNTTIEGGGSVVVWFRGEQGDKAKAHETGGASEGRSIPIRRITPTKKQAVGIGVKELGKFAKKVVADF